MFLQDWVLHPNYRFCFLLYSTPFALSFFHLFKIAAENMGNDGFLYCVLTFPLGCGCCVLTVLGEEAATRRGIDVGIPSSALCSCCNLCTCYACTVAHETRLIRQSAALDASSNSSSRQAAAAVPKNSPMERN